MEFSKSRFPSGCSNRRASLWLNGLSPVEGGLTWAWEMEQERGQIDKGQGGLF